MEHFLQTEAWARFQTSLNRTVIQQHGDGWNYQAILEAGKLNTRLYCPYGPTLDSSAALDGALASLKQQAKLHRATFIRVEPTGDIDADTLKARGLKPVTYQQLQPKHTQIIDLTIDETELIAQMHQNTRNLYRNFSKKGISIHQTSNPDDIQILTSLLHKMASRNHINLHNDSYFSKQAETLLPSGDAKLFYASYENKPIAAALVYDSETTRYYAHAAADDAYRKLNAGTALLAYMIVDAKRAGKTSFDLYGIAPDDDPHHPWAGFTKFKKSFGGQTHNYVGAWDLPRQPLRYWIYRLYQTVRHR